MINAYRGFAAALLATGLVAGPASAQTAQGAIVSGAISLTASDSNTSLSIAASAGYRFNRAMALTIELTYVPSLESEPDFGFDFAPFGRGVSNSLTNSTIAFVSPRFSNPGGRLALFTTNIRLEMPTTSRRVLPYAVLGGGAANIRENFDVVYGFPAGAAQLIGAPVPIGPIVQSYTDSSTDLALTLGGGVSLLRGDHLSVDIDLRYLRLLGYKDRSVGRFGAGVSYRF